MPVPSMTVDTCFTQTDSGRQESSGRRRPRQGAGAEAGPVRLVLGNRLLHLLEEQPDGPVVLAPIVEVLLYAGRGSVLVEAMPW